MVRRAWERKKVKLRSTLEDKVNAELEKVLGKELSEYYEVETLEYTVPSKVKKYTPDFKIAEGVFIETKGIWDRTDREKILLLKQQRPDIRILMLFWNSSYKIYPKSKTTYADYCDANGIEWADSRLGIPKEWLECVEQEPTKLKKPRKKKVINGTK